MQKKWLRTDIDLEDNIAIVFSQLSIKMKKNFLEITLNSLNADTIDQTTANMLNFFAKLKTKSVAEFVSTNDNTQKNYREKKNTIDTDYKKKPNATKPNMIDKFVADMNAIGEKFIAGGD